MVPGYMVTAWAPNAEEVQELLDASAGSGGARRVLISTGALQAVMPPALSIGDPTGLTFDAAASRGLLVGSALVPALGLKIGTVSLKARHRKPIAVARRLLDRMFGADRG
jgi:hypothetical protein